MKILIHEHVLTIKTEDEVIVDVVRSNNYVISPDAGKLLRDKRTGFTTDSSIGVDTKEDIQNYEEIYAI